MSFAIHLCVRQTGYQSERSGFPPKSYLTRPSAFRVYNSLGPRHFSTVERFVYIYCVLEEALLT